MLYPETAEVLATQERSTRCWFPPAPVNDTPVGELEALLTNETVPVVVPVTVGEKATLNEVFWPGESVRGKVKPVMLNVAPVTFACEIVALPVPVLVTISGATLLLPSVTVPKLTVVAFVAN